MFDSRSATAINLQLFMVEMTVLESLRCLRSVFSPQPILLRTLSVSYMGGGQHGLVPLSVVPVVPPPEQEVAPILCQSIPKSAMALKVRAGCELF